MSKKTKPIKICITGGPSGGKTTLIEALQKDFSEKMAVVPESASILYRGGFPRHPNPIGKKYAQRAIYFTQRELEDLIADESNPNVMVCDRGSLDSIAYWPGPAEDYFTSLHTTQQKEFARYNWIIHMDTAAHNGFDTTNPVRVESHSEALQLNKKIKAAWEGHPHRLIIAHDNDFILKLARARKAISMIIAGAELKQIQAAIESVSI